MSGTFYVMSLNFMPRKKKHIGAGGGEQSGAARGAKRARTQALPHPTMRCLTCSRDKGKDFFSNTQRKKPAGKRRCAGCAAAAAVTFAGGSTGPAPRKKL